MELGPGGAALHAGDRAQQLNLLVAERAGLLLDLAGELGDRVIKEIDVREDPPDDQAVLGVEPFS